MRDASSARAGRAGFIGSDAAAVEDDAKSACEWGADEVPGSSLVKLYQQYQARYRGQMNPRQTIILSRKPGSS